MGEGRGFGGCFSCIKYLMFIFNFVFWLVGCAILGVGIWVRVDQNFRQYVDNSETFNYLYTGAYILIAAGILIMIIGFLGCCGAIRESQCLLGLFFVFLFLIFAILLAAGVWAIVSKDSMRSSMTDVLRDAVTHYDSDKKKQTLMDNVQKNLNCCGADKASADYGYRVQKGIPKSCGVNFSKPCDKELFAYLNENLAIIAGIAIGVGVIMFAGLLMSLYLMCMISRHNRLHKAV